MISTDHHQGPVAFGPAPGGATAGRASAGRGPRAALSDLAAQRGLGLPQGADPPHPLTLPWEDYLALARQRAWRFFADTGPDTLLSADWSPAPKIPRPPWWTASTDTPAGAVSANPARGASPIGKWEDGRVFLIIEDSGRRGSASGEGNGS